VSTPSLLLRFDLRQRLAARGFNPATLLILPALALTAALFLYPFAYGLVLSFPPQAGRMGRELCDLLLRPISL
jgi:ABC-type sugar transport system permease subunit